VSSFLRANGWHATKSISGRSVRFVPPAALEAPDGFTLSLPADENSEEASAIVDRVWPTLGALYSVSSTDLLARVSNSVEIFTTRFQGRAYRSGTPPIAHFHTILDRVKGLLLKTAGFVFSSDPGVSELPKAARDYLSACRFLATERGSFVTKVAVPRTGVIVGDVDLFGLKTDAGEVTSTVEGLTSLLLDRVLRGEARVFQELGILEERSAIGLPAVKEYRRLLSVPDASSLEVSFSSASGVRSFESGSLDKLSANRLKSFEKAAKEVLASDRMLDIVGVVTEIKSRNAERNRNLIGITAEIDGRIERVTFRAGRDDFIYFLSFLKPHVRIRLRGTATRLRTQLRVNRLDALEPIP
jgi:hypothetical protein